MATTTMTDLFKGAPVDLSDPASNLAAIVPNDTTPLPWVTRFIYVGVTGDIVLVANGNGVTVTLKAVPAGAIIPVRAKLVKATGTTATNLVALW
jgi:hypothetical protein